MRKFTKEISSLLASAAVTAALSGTTTALCAHAEQSGGTQQPISGTAVSTTNSVGQTTLLSGTMVYGQTEGTTADDYFPDGTDMIGTMEPEDVIETAATEIYPSDTTMMGTSVTTTTYVEDVTEMIGTVVAEITGTETIGTSMPEDTGPEMIGTEVYESPGTEMIGTEVYGDPGTEMIGTEVYGDPGNEMIGTTVTETTTTTTVTTPPIPPLAGIPMISDETTCPPLAGEALPTDGDINIDGNTNVSDAILLARLIAEDPTVVITHSGMQNADLNNSGAPDQEDLVMLLKQIAGIHE